MENEENMLSAISDRIIVELDSQNESAIWQPENSAKVVNKGIVLSTGPLVLHIKKGDHIVFHPFDELALPEKNMVVIREKSVLSIYEKEV